MSKHQKAISALKTFPVKRKERSWAIKPSPGPHPQEDSIPLGIVVRDVLGYAESVKEVKEILNQEKCKVDGRVIKDHRFPLGIFDSLTLGQEYYRVVPSKRGFKLVEIDETQASVKLCRVEDKKVVKGEKLQLNLNDGKNLLLEGKEVDTDDALLLGLPNLEIQEVVKREEGCKVIVTQGKNRGKIAELKELNTVKSSKPNRAVVERNEKEIDLPEKLVFPVGEDKPLIEIGRLDG